MKYYLAIVAIVLEYLSLYTFSLSSFFPFFINIPLTLLYLSFFSYYQNRRTSQYLASILGLAYDFLFSFFLGMHVIIFLLSVYLVCLCKQLNINLSRKNCIFFFILILVFKQILLSILYWQYNSWLFISSNIWGMWFINQLIASSLLVFLFFPFLSSLLKIKTYGKVILNE